MAKRPPAARTAFGPMFVTAMEQYTPPAHRLVDDELADRFLPEAVRLTVRLGRSRYLREHLATWSDRRAFGVWGGVLCRKRYAREQVRQAIEAGIPQLVMLGAGLDTMAYGLAAPAGVPAFEVDMPANIDHKRARARASLGGLPDTVRLVPIDFETDDLADTLAHHGFRLDTPAMFVWEAVSQYLTEDGVRRTLAFLAKASAGSRLIFTYVRKDFFDGTNFYGAESLHQDFVTRGVWHFAIAPEDVTGLLREFGWAEREQVGPAEYRSRYLRSAGRELATSEIERFVYAEKP